MLCTICHKSREGEPVYVHPDDDGIDGMHPTCAMEHIATLTEMLNGAEADNATLRAQLAEAREAARVLMHAALTRTSIVSLEQIHAIDTVEKWEGK